MESMDTDDQNRESSPSSTTSSNSNNKDNNNSSGNNPSQQQQAAAAADPPLKIKKKPGRKPNPASPALRKAQNRAAQRAFRERKERHLRELETTIKQVQEQRDKLYRENEQLKVDNDTLRSENWYLKGIVLSLQLVCYQHNLVIPQHSPYINDQALSVLAQSIPEPIASYLDVNAKNKFPATFHKLDNHKRSIRGDRYVSSGSIIVTEDGVRPASNSSIHSPFFHQSSSAAADPQQRISIPDLTPVSPKSNHSSSAAAVDDIPAPPHPVMLSPEPVTSNLAAIQTLRLRLRLQAAVCRTKSLPFAIQPTLLQLTVPHDPRIDLIPTSHMRDRMILFRDQFDLDECFQCLLTGSVFHGGDPAVAANWQLPPEFFKKFWFLTIDFSLQRTTNRWRRLQGLKEIDQSFPSTTSDVDPTPSLEPVTTSACNSNPRAAQSAAVQQQRQPQLDMDNLSALLHMDLDAAAAATTLNSNVNQDNDSSSSSSNNNIKNLHNTIFISPSQLSYPSSLASTASSSNLSSNNTINHSNVNHSLPPSSTQSTTTSTSLMADKDALFSPTPIQLTSGYLPATTCSKINSSKPSWAQHPTWHAYHQQQQQQQFQFSYESGQNRYHFG